MYTPEELIKKCGKVMKINEETIFFFKQKGKTIEEV